MTKPSEASLVQVHSLGKWFLYLSINGTIPNLEKAWLCAMCFATRIVYLIHFVDNMNTTVVCSESVPCYGGTCIDGSCFCFSLWSGDLCEDNVLQDNESMYNFFWAYLWMTLVVFALIAVAAIIQLVFVIVDSQRHARRVNSVKILLFALIALIGISKLIKFLPIQRLIK